MIAPVHFKRFVQWEALRCHNALWVDVKWRIHLSSCKHVRCPSDLLLRTQTLLCIATAPPKLTKNDTCLLRYAHQPTGMMTSQPYYVPAPATSEAAYVQMVMQPSPSAHDSLRKPVRQPPMVSQRPMPEERKLVSQRPMLEEQKTDDPLGALASGKQTSSAYSSLK